MEMTRLLNPSLSRILGVTAAALLACLMLAPVTSAQTQPTETDWRTQMARDPNNPTPYIELARIYAEQQRYADAIRMLQTAIGVLQQASVLPRLQPSVTTAPPPAPPRDQPIMPGDFVRVGGDIKEPKKIRHVAPVYPDVALQARVQGVVILEVMIDTAGNVTDATILRSIALLDQAAVDAVRQWRFTPTLVNGAPVNVIMTVTVNFTLN
jgi:TonB family protein